jgi:hypothetical protein
MLLSKAVAITLITPASTFTKLETLKSYSPHKLVIASVGEQACDASSNGLCQLHAPPLASAWLCGVHWIANDLVAGLKFRTNRHAPIFNARVVDQNAQPRDETSSPVAGANQALDQRHRYFHHDRQRMEDL